MLRSLAISAFAAFVAAAPLFAQDSNELAALRAAVEKQGRQIEMLTAQVARLTAAIENKNSNAPTEASATPSAAPASSPADPPRAEPAQPGMITHTVAKGETLTSIARQHKVQIADLLKANKIEDDRKLQIGQTLFIPAPQASPSPTTP
jgi:LysM repeat protein